MKSMVWDPGEDGKVSKRLLLQFDHAIVTVVVVNTIRHESYVDVIADVDGLPLVPIVEE